MRWFNGDKLKEDISSGQLTQPEMLNYWRLFAVLSLIGLLPVAYRIHWSDYLTWFISLVIGLWVIQACYSANGGRTGAGFSDKLVAASCVYSIRALVLIVLPLAVLAGLVWGDDLTDLVLNGIVIISQLWMSLRIVSLFKGLRAA